MRRVVIALVALLGAVLICGVVAVAILVSIDLRPIVERRASDALGRKLVMEALSVTVVGGISIDVKGLRLANPAWTSTPDLARLGHLSAHLNPWKLLRGVPQFQNVVVEGLSVALERSPEGVGNWQFHDHPVPAKPGSDRASVPVILDLAVRNSRLTMRTTSGSLLREDVKTLVLHTTADDQAIELSAEGDHDSTPVRIEGTLQSFRRLRDATAPFGVALTAFGATTAISLTGTMTDPLNFDGIKGDLQGKVEKLGAVLTMFGEKARADIPLTLASPITRQGDDWRLPAMTGDINGASYTGNLHLTEGGRAQPDNIQLVLDIARLDVDALRKLTKPDAAGAASGKPTSLAVDNNPGALVDARLGAKQVLWNGTKVDDLAFRLVVAPGKVALSDVSFGLAGGKVEGETQLTGAGTGGAITAHAAATGLDMSQILHMAGADTGMIAGQMSGRGNLTMAGPTLDAALGAARGQAVLAMIQGQVAREVIQAASTDLGRLFGKAKGTVRIVCFLAVADISGGIAALAPMRMRTPDGTLFGGGTVDLRRGTMDLTLKTESKSTGFFSLDIPVQITGGLNDPSVRPVLKGVSNPLAARAAANLRQLPPDLLTMANGNGCVR